MKKTIIALSIFLGACTEPKISVECKRAELIIEALAPVIEGKDFESKESRMSTCMAVKMYLLKDRSINKLSTMSTSKYTEFMTTKEHECSIQTEQEELFNMFLTALHDVMDYIDNHEHCLKN